MSIILLSFFCIFFNCHSTYGRQPFLCHEEESSSFLQFKQSIFVTDMDCTCPPSTDISSWNIGTDCCSRHDVQCNNDTGHVILIYPSQTSSFTRPLTRLSSNSMSQSNAESTAAYGAKKPEDVLVQYVVLRRDLIDTWPTGSVVAQGCHAAVAAIWGNKEDLHMIQYCSPENIDSMHKVTVEVKGETQILNLSEKLNGGGIVHKLWIEQPENIPTSIATKPYPKSVVSSFFKKLKLCK